MSKDMSNYIKLSRDLYNHAIWVCDEPFSKGQAWVDLLMRANWQRTVKVYKSREYVIERGQLITSVRALSERWKWHKDKTCRFLAMLVRMGMISRTKTVGGTLLTIENYSIFQGDADSNTDSNTDSRTEMYADSHTDYKKNIKNIKNNKKGGVVPRDPRVRC